MASEECNECRISLQSVSSGALVESVKAVFPGQFSLGLSFWRVPECTSQYFNTAT